MTAYISTRGPGASRSFSDVLLAGMAPDGGLFVPERWPRLGAAELLALRGRPYAEIAFAVMKPFVGGALTDEELRGLIADTYEGGAFDHPDVAPLVAADDGQWIMELFHGPTFSFKDYALQFLGRLFDHVLERQGKRLTIVGATSGDTGSAAIEACRGCRHVDIFILYPDGRTSDVQRRQMTTVDAPNVHMVAVQGTFDDCQAAVKALFADEALRDELSLSAVNSINWVRIMAQIVYYVAAGVRLGAHERAVSFAVPTGNFGNVFAGWAARRMGLPVERLVVGTNRNDILTRFFETGAMAVDAVTPSLSPSMDIQVSSNFERYLCELTGRDHGAVREMMAQFAATRRFEVVPEMLARAQGDFSAWRCSDPQTLAVIREYYERTGMVVDPHTAVGLYAAEQARRAGVLSGPLVALACAHPAKFSDAVEKAAGMKPVLPEGLAAVMDKPEFVTRLPADLAQIRDFIRARARGA